LPRKSKKKSRKIAKGKKPKVSKGKKTTAKKSAVKKQAKAKKTTAKKSTKKEEPKPEMPWEKNGVVWLDGLRDASGAIKGKPTIMHVWGDYIDLTPVISSGEEKTEGTVTIRDMDGKEHKARVKDMATFKPLLWKHDFDDMKKIVGKSRAQMYKVLKDEVIPFPRSQNHPGSPLCFKIVIDKENGNWLLGNNTKRWTPIKADDYIGLVRNTVKPFDGDVNITRSDGIHGGHISVKFPKQELFSTNLDIDFGRFDGYHAIHIKGGSQILACLNQLSFDVGAKMKPIVKLGFTKRRLHEGTVEEFTAELTAVIDALKQIGGVLSASKRQKVAANTAVEIIDYYRHIGWLTAKTEELVKSMIGNPIVFGKLKKAEAVKLQGTVYELAMIATYIGTHNEEVKSEHSQYDLKRMGGELIACSTSHKEYLKIVRDYNKEWTEREKKRQEELKKKAKKEAKKDTPKKAQKQPKAASKPKGKGKGKVKDKKRKSTKKTTKKAKSA